MSIVNIYDRRKKIKLPKLHIFKKSMDWEVPDGYKSADIFCVGGGSAGSGICQAQVTVRHGGDSTGASWSAKEVPTVYGGGSSGFCRTEKNINIEPRSTLKIQVGRGGLPWVPRYYQNSSFYKNFYTMDDMKILLNYPCYTGKGQLTSIVPPLQTNAMDVSFILFNEIKEYDKYYTLSGINYNKPLNEWGGNVCSGEESSVSYNNKKLAYARGSYGYAISNDNHYGVSLKDNIQYCSNYNRSGGSFGGAVGYDGETNGGKNYFNNTNIHYDDVLWYNESMRKRFYSMGLFYNITSDTNLKTYCNTYNSLFTNRDFEIKYSYTYYGSGIRGSSTERVSKSTHWIFGNQNMLSYWLGQSNTRAFGESDGEIFAAGGTGRQDISERINGAPNTGNGGSCAVLSSTTPGINSSLLGGEGGSGIIMMRLFPNENRMENINWADNTEIHN